MRRRRNRIVIEFDWPTFVRTLRELYIGCSQEDLARTLDVCTRTIWNWENDVVRPTWRNRSRLLSLAVNYKYTRRQWPAKSWVEPWCDDTRPAALRRRTAHDRRRKRYRDRSHAHPGP